MNNHIEIKPNETVVGRAAKLDLLFSQPLFDVIFLLIWSLGITSLLVILLNFTIIVFVNQIVGLAFIFLAVFMVYLAGRFFFLDKVKYPKVTTLEETKKAMTESGTVNLFSIFSFHLAKSTLSLFNNKAIDQITTKDMVLAILKSKDMIFVLIRIGVGPQNIEQMMAGYAGQTGILEYLERAVEIALSETHHQIEIGDVFVALCEKDSFFKEMIMNLKLDTKDIANLVYWRTNIVRETIKSKSFFNPDKFRLNGGIGKDWAFGYTPLLKQYASDITNSIKSHGLNLEIYGKAQTIKQIEEAMLHQSGGNVLVVGEPGIGKKTTVLAFAKNVYEGKTNGALAFFHIVQIDLDTLLSGQGDFVAKISGLFNEIAMAGNIIVFIDNIQNILSAGAEGKVNATEVLLPYLSSSNIKIIGTCDMASYNQYIMMNTAINQRFTRVTIEEPLIDDMVRILEDIAPRIESNTGSIVSYVAIKTAIDAADRYIMNQPNPQKTIALIDGASAKASSERGSTIILPKDILTYVTEKYDVPSSEVGDSEKEKLLHLDEMMHKFVIGQNQAIDAIADALRRTRAGVTDTKKPIGSFLFLGPTGVGKTETAKALARSYFGAEDRMIRFDMSEYQNKEDIYRFLGSNLHGEMTQGTLTTAVREHPFSLLLFDEIEKANRDILDLFLQILDEGFMTDGSGRKVSFTNTIIIATSNAGANLIRDSIKSGQEYEKTKKDLLDYLQTNNIYRPEFLNRFTSVIAFSPISPSEIRQIAGLMIQKLKATILKNRQVTLEIEPAAVEILAQLGYDPQMGARPMARIIQDKVENFLAKKILSGELQQGSSITVTADDIQPGGVNVMSDQSNLTAPPAPPAQ